MTAPADLRPPGDGDLLDTVPEEPRRRARGGFGLGSLAAAWRQLTSMRTALLLLFLLACAAVPGSVFPQRGVEPVAVARFIAEHPSLGPFLDRLSFFDVFAAPWFAAVYALLFVSLIGCVVPRTRTHVRALLRRPPPAPAHPARLASGATWTTAAPPEQVVAAARAVLHGRRFRVVAGERTVSAEKGYLRETGNLVFHLALVGVLAGVALAGLFGYWGRVLLVEGRSFTNTLVQYDSFMPGTSVDAAGLRPFGFRLEEFSAAYRETGQPVSFAADVAFRGDRGAAEEARRIEVNDPLRVGEASVFLIGHGYAPRFVLRDPATGTVLFDEHVPCNPTTPNFDSTCVVKIPDTGLPAVGPRQVPQQIAVEGVLTPTLPDDRAPVSVSPEPRRPALRLQVYVGDLGLNAGLPQNVYVLDREDLTRVPTDGPSGPGNPEGQLLLIDDPAQRTVTGLPGGLVLEVAGMREWASFDVRHDPGKGLVLWSAAVMIMGLLASLFVRRRRVFVRVADAGEAGGGVPDAPRTLVEMGGLARTGDVGAEFADLVRRVRDRLGDAGEPEPHVEPPIDRNESAEGPAWQR